MFPLRVLALAGRLYIVVSNFIDAYRHVHSPFRIMSLPRPHTLSLLAIIVCNILYMVRVHCSCISFLYSFPTLFVLSDDHPPSVAPTQRILTHTQARISPDPHDLSNSYTSYPYAYRSGTNRAVCQGCVLCAKDSDYNATRIDIGTMSGHLFMVRDCKPSQEL